MKTLNDREIKRVLTANGFTLVRMKGSHEIWEHQTTKRHLCIPYKLENKMIWRRLCKEFTNII